MSSRLTFSIIFYIMNSGNVLERSKERDELVSFWSKIYQQHMNEADEEWNDEKQRSYNHELGENQHRTFPRILTEHMDMVKSIEHTVDNMEKPKVTTRQTQHYMCQMRSRTAPGPAIREVQHCLNSLRMKLQKKSWPEGWASGMNRYMFSC